MHGPRVGRGRRRPQPKRRRARPRCIGCSVVRSARPSRRRSRRRRRPACSSSTRWRPAPGPWPGRGVEQVPAEDAVDRAGRSWKPLRGAPWRARSRVRPGVPLDFGEEVLDEDLAGQPLAEERDVLPDDRTEVHEGPATRASASAARNRGSTLVVRTDVGFGPGDAGAGGGAHRLSAAFRPPHLNSPGTLDPSRRPAARNGEASLPRRRRSRAPAPPPA